MGAAYGVLVRRSDPRSILSKRSPGIAQRNCGSSAIQANELRIQQVPLFVPLIKREREPKRRRISRAPRRGRYYPLNDRADYPGRIAKRLLVAFVPTLLTHGELRGRRMVVTVLSVMALKGRELGAAALLKL